MNRIWPLLLLALLSSCIPKSISIRAEPIETPQPLLFELVPGQTAVERFDPPGAGARVELSLAAQVINPNAFGVTLKRIAYEIALAGTAVGRGELVPDVFIGAGAQAPLRFTIAASLEDERELIRAVAGAFTDTPLAFEISGIVVFASRSHEFSTRNATLLGGETMAREVITPPQLRLIESESSVFRLRPDAPVIRAVVSATNPGSIGYFLYGQDVTISLGGLDFAVQDVAPVPVPTGQESRFELLFYPAAETLSAEKAQVFEAALGGIPTLLEVKGDLLLDVLSVDTYSIEDGWRVSGFIFTENP